MASTIRFNIAIWILILIIGCQSNISKDESLNEQEQSPALVNEEEEDYSFLQCQYRKVSSQFISSTPFSISDKVEIVSFKTRLFHNLGTELIREGKFIVPDIKQRLLLNKADQDSLFSILYNFKQKGDGDEWYPADCYDPHHAVIFHKDGKAIAFLEVCFSCEQTLQTEGLNFGTLCTEKWCMLQKFFKDRKVEYGIIDEICEKSVTQK